MLNLRLKNAIISKVKGKNMIDLHSHSTASDGQLSPSALVDKAVRIGLSALALTDHDVVSGLDEFQKQADLYPKFKAINGCELGAKHYANIEIIALDIPDIAPFAEREKKLIDIRNNANKERLEKLASLGMKIDYDEIAFDENGKVRTLIGKPHIVDAMLKHGYISEHAEGYKKYLNKGCPAYVKKQDPDWKETISFIKENGAVAVLAHPRFTGLDGKDLFDAIAEMKQNGLDGIEVFHAEHSPDQMRQYFSIAKELNLIVSGGSDFHGMAHPETELGYGIGKNLNILDGVLDVIINRGQPNFNLYQECLNSCLKGQIEAVSSQNVLLGHSCDQAHNQNVR